MASHLNPPTSNPIIPGLYADPDILISNGKYYIYPTTDGNHWESTQFHVFESSDLVHWQDGGIILDVAISVPWATGYAWAPAVIERHGKIYFYYCANQRIGAAVSDSPLGPFINLSCAAPLIDYADIKGRVELMQIIDPYLFHDNGKYYILFGNGRSPAIAELNDDMHSIKWETLKQIIFDRNADFREAICVFKRNGLYYFSWSCDDTRSENYHVNYGTAPNLFTPIQVQGTILRKNTSKGILATGHHTILNDHGNYYIIYHRFTTDTSVNASGEERGYNREICIDKLNFDECGRICEVEVT